MVEENAFEFVHRSQNTSITILALYIRPSSLRYKNSRHRHSVPLPVIDIPSRPKPDSEPRINFPPTNYTKARRDLSPSETPNIDRGFFFLYGKKPTTACRRHFAEIRAFSFCIYRLLVVRSRGEMLRAAFYSFL